MKRKSKGRVNKGIFSESWDYVKESRNYIYFATLFFFVSSVVGFLLAGHLRFLDKILVEMFSQTNGLDSFQLIIFIFKNNFLSALNAIALGIFLGIIPIILAGFNGILLGYVAAKVVPLAGFFELWRILPHGIFELPAIFLSIGLGIRLGGVFFVGRKNMKNELIYRLDRTLKAIVAFVLPLLIIAAIIEGILIGLGI